MHPYGTPHIIKLWSQLQLRKLLYCDFQVVMLRLAKDVINTSWYFNTEKGKKRREELHSLALALTLTVTLGPNHPATSHCWWLRCTELSSTHQHPTLQRYTWRKDDVLGKLQYNNLEVAIQRLCKLKSTSEFCYVWHAIYPSSIILLTDHFPCERVGYGHKNRYWYLRQYHRDLTCTSLGKQNNSKRTALLYVR